MGIAIRQGALRPVAFAAVVGEPASVKPFLFNRFLQ